MVAERVTALVVFGTRPEAIKLAPVIYALRDHPGFTPIVCVSGQHRDLLDQALAPFSIIPDYDLDVMVDDQDLVYVTRAVLARLTPVLEKKRPDVVIVQGDAQTAFVGALAAYYAKIPVAHVEAGLRTGNPYAPYPEEMNRRLIDHIAAFLFAPTETAKQALLREGIHAQAIAVTGNTEIDALRYVERNVPPPEQFAFPGKIVLVTAHRRESFSGGLTQICAGLRRIAADNADVTIVYSVHPNPRVQQIVRAELTGRDRIVLIDPPDYASFVHLMRSATLILTDSGGIQEAGAALHVPVLVLRDVTERMEGVHTGAAQVVGTDPDRIATAATHLLRSPDAHARMQAAKNPYGDGHAAARIVQFLERSLL